MSFLLVFGFLFCFHSQADVGVHPPVHPFLSSEVQVIVWWTYCCLVESYLFLHAGKTRSCSFCFTAKLPELCTLHVNLTPSSCLCIHSSDAWSSSDPSEGRKMGGDAGCRGDVDAQLETCCFLTESKLFVSVAWRCHRWTDFQNPGDVDCKSCCKSASFSQISQKSISCSNNCNWGQSVASALKWTVLQLMFCCKCS